MANKLRLSGEVCDNEEPVENWECERSKKFESIQDNSNPFVKDPCVEKEGLRHNFGI